MYVCVVCVATLGLIGRLLLPPSEMKVLQLKRKLLVSLGMAKISILTAEDNILKDIGEIPLVQITWLVVGYQ